MHNIAGGKNAKFSDVVCLGVGTKFQGRNYR